jgi:hypothetical protein
LELQTGNKKERTMAVNLGKFTLPAGEYFIGDPCYVLDDAARDSLFVQQFGREYAPEASKDSYEYTDKVLYEHPDKEKSFVVFGTGSDGGFNHNLEGFDWEIFVDSGQIERVLHTRT